MKIVFCDQSKDGKMDKGVWNRFTNVCSTDLHTAVKRKRKRSTPIWGQNNQYFSPKKKTKIKTLL